MQKISSHCTIWMIFKIDWKLQFSVQSWNKVDERGDGVVGGWGDREGKEGERYIFWSCAHVSMMETKSKRVKIVWQCISHIFIYLTLTEKYAWVLPQLTSTGINYVHNISDFMVDVTHLNNNIGQSRTKSM